MLAVLRCNNEQSTNACTEDSTALVVDKNRQLWTGIPQWDFPASSLSFWEILLGISGPELSILIYY